MSKRILHIAEAAGGVERYLVTLLSKMREYDEFEHLLVCSTSYDISKFENLVTDVTIIKSMHNDISTIEDAKAIKEVRKAIKYYNPDIVYCHSSKAGAIGRLANRGIRNKLIYNPHGWSFSMKGISQNKIRAYVAVEKVLAPLTDKIICISEYEKIAALEHKICGEDKLIVINNGIDFDELKRINPKKREELGIPTNAFVIGMIGRLSKQKSPDIFVRMASEIKKNLQESYFVIVGDDIGDGQTRIEIEKLIDEFGLTECFLITGWVDNPLDYACVFDVATLLSRWEGFGLVLPEYMMLEKPIVATRVDAIPYIIKDAGMLVDVDNYMQAAQSVIKIKNNEQLRNQIISDGIKRVKKFDAQRTAVELADLITDSL